MSTSSRYTRQTRVPLLADAGQARLQKAHVLIIGAGGLGSAASLYLAGAGIGHLTLADGDTVQCHNLHRQILYATSECGQRKAVCARERLQALNDEVHIDIITTHLCGKALVDAVAAADVVLDCTDNHETRYALNAASVVTQTPWISGSVEGVQGQLMAFTPPFASGCYACLYPPDPPPATPMGPIGILGPIAGVIGALQALDVIRLIATGDTPLSQRLMLFDGLHYQWRALKRARLATCPVCGDNACISPSTIT